MRKAIDIGQVFLDLAKKSSDERSNSLSPLKLMKLVYIAHGWMLALNDEILVEDDIEVWQYGPTIANLYHSVKKYGGNAITADISDFNIDKLSKEEKAIVTGTFRLYGDSSTWYLSNICHKVGSPWDKCVDADEDIIPNEMIREYYLELISKKKRGKAA